MSSASVPASWKTVTLGDVASVSRGASPRPIASPRWFESTSGVGWVRISDLGRSDGLTLMATTQRLSAEGIARSRYLPPDTLILSIAATVGVPIVTGIPTCIHDGFVSIENLKGVHQPYLLYALKAAQSALRKAGQTGSQANVNSDIVKKLPLLLPSEEEQRAIAGALRDADELILSLQRLISKKQAVKQGLMQELLTGSTRLGGFSDAWPEVRLGDHVAYVGSAPLSRAQLDHTSPLRYLHYGDIHTRTAVLLDAEREVMPRVDAALVGKAGRLRPGDLVFADASEDPTGVGKSVEVLTVPSAGVVPGLHTIAARFDQRVLADGFKAFLQFIPAFGDSLLRLAAGTKVLATTRSGLSSITLPLPGLAEQQEISLVLRDAEAEIDGLAARLDKARNIKEGMMQELLTGRTRLPVQGEGDE